MSEEQWGKMAKDQENFQFESQRTIPPLVYPRSVPMIPLPIMSVEQLEKIAKDQENFQLESQRTDPYGRSIPLIPLPIPFVPKLVST